MDIEVIIDAAEAEDVPEIHLEDRGVRGHGQGPDSIGRK
jgi:hypothetical protein